MRSQACISCAKRKVRCDRVEPCSNCKRRGDDCLFPDVSAADRIKSLELLVRKLGGDPEDASLEEQASGAGESSLRTTANPTSEGARDRTADSTCGTVHASPDGDQMLLTDEEQTVYLDSFQYYSWQGNENRGQDEQGSEDGFRRAATLTSPGTDALQSIIAPFESIDLEEKLPKGREAAFLWEKYRRRVQPLIKILFDWEIDELQTVATAAERRLDSQQYALIHSVYFTAAICLLEEECLQLGWGQSALISHRQTACEQALAKSKFVWAADLVVVQALTMYIVAGSERFNARSLWSLTGVAVRGAERLGIHRDGSLFNLSAVETERRRRLWWHLQHLELSMTMLANATPMTIMADWDTKMPLNIEDVDLQRGGSGFPEERKGLTGISHGLCVYWFIQETRNFRRENGTPFGLRWITDRSLSRAQRESRLQELEDGINHRFLQYCEPIRQIDVLTQYISRSFLCSLRRVMLHSVALVEGTQNDKGLWEALLDACVQLLEYNIILHTSSVIQNFRWRTGTFFQWSALMCLVIEAGNQRDKNRVAEIWDFLCRLYSANKRLSRVSEDRRCFHAGELIVALWKKHKDLLHEKPYFVSKLETQLSIVRPGMAQTESSQRAKRKRKGESQVSRPSRPPPSPESDLITDRMTLPYLQDGGNASNTMAIDPDGINFIADLRFDDIDWGFWDSITWNAVALEGQCGG